MKRNIIAAAVAVMAAGQAAAAGSALEALNTSVKSGIMENFSITEPEAKGKVYGGDYVNDRGCAVTVERRGKGSIIYVQDGGRQATLGVLDDLSGGDIFSFCSPAEAAYGGGALRLSCGEQDSGGYYNTRGEAVVEMGDGITSVRVRGEVKRALGWRVDTDIVCDGLRPAAAKAVRGLSGTYRRNDGYTSASLSVREAAGGGLEFELLAVAGPSGHTGEISGTAVRNSGGDFVFRGPGGCRLTLRPGAGAMEVSGGDMSCGDYMGLNVAVDGKYTRN